MQTVMLHLLSHRVLITCTSVNEVMFCPGLLACVSVNTICQSPLAKVLYSFEQSELETKNVFI